MTSDEFEEDQSAPIGGEMSDTESAAMLVTILIMTLECEPQPLTLTQKMETLWYMSTWNNGDIWLN